MENLSLLRKISNIAWKQNIVHERKSESKFKSAERVMERATCGRKITDRKTSDK